MSIKNQQEANIFQGVKRLYQWKVKYEEQVINDIIFWL